MTIDERIARLEALKELVETCKRNYDYYIAQADCSDYHQLRADAWQVVMMEINKLADK